MNNWITFEATFLGIAALCSGILLGTFIAEHDYQQKALSHNCAQFDPKTGAFVWLEKTTQP